MKKLREFYNQEQLKDLYKNGYDHTTSIQHKLRVALSIQLAVWTINRWNLQRVADFSCGDGHIISELIRSKNVTEAIIGDFAQVNVDKVRENLGINEDVKISYHVGDISQLLSNVEKDIDLFILTETIEHVEDPEKLLYELSKKVRFLILSTPIDEQDAGNPEHYWGWSNEEMNTLLIDNAWEPIISNPLHFKEKALVYDFQLWLTQSRRKF